LLGNFTGCGQGFDKDGLIIGNGRRNHKKVFNRQDKKISKGAISTLDA